MRPESSAHVVVLATRGTSEEEFAQNQTRHLASKGVSVRDGAAKAFDDADGVVATADPDGEADEPAGDDGGEGEDAESSTDGDSSKDAADGEPSATPE
jgi:DNA excision repair protein ERCC-3